jgi:hypothetical protein
MRGEQHSALSRPCSGIGPMRPNYQRAMRTGQLSRKKYTRIAGFQSGRGRRVPGYRLASGILAGRQELGGSSGWLQAADRARRRSRGSRRTPLPVRPRERNRDASESCLVSRDRRGPSLVGASATPGCRVSRRRPRANVTCLVAYPHAISGQTGGTGRDCAIAGPYRTPRARGGRRRGRGRARTRRSASGPEPRPASSLPARPAS